MGKYSKSNKMPKRVVVNGGAAGIKGPSPPKTPPPTPALPYRRATRIPMAKTCAWKNHAAEALRKTRAAGSAQADLELLQEIGLTRGHELDAVRVAAANEQVDIPRGGFLQRELEDGRGPEEERGREE